MGPIEQRVARDVAAAADTEPGKVLAAVETTRARLGDVVVDVAALPGALTVEALGEQLAGLPYVTKALPVPPRLYLTLADDALASTVAEAIAAAGARYGDSAELAGRTVAVASADPNLNKALHVGHLRNAALGSVVAHLFQAAGARVRRTCMESDWGPHIAEAVVGYLKWGGGATPESAGVRPGEFVGQLYARYHEARRADPASVESDHGAFVARMVAGEPEAAQLVSAVTGWAADGIHALYARAGITFDEVRRERSRLGDSLRVVDDAVASGAFGRRDDGSVYVDLAAYGLPEVTLVRRNGLPVSYTQWLGVDYERYGDGSLDRIVQLDGAEWQAANLPYEAILDRLGAPWLGCREVAYYGMVNGAKGRKLGSRTGEALTADALLDTVRDRLTTLLAAPDGEPLPAAAAEDAAVGLVTYALLRRRRIDPLVFDFPTLYGTVLPEYAALLRLCGGAVPPGGRAARALALELNETPRVLSRALAELDGMSVLRHLGFVAKHAATGCPDPLRGPVATVVRKGLAVLNVRVPEQLLDRLPPDAVLRKRARTA